jgi:hypothetical protein
MDLGASMDTLRFVIRDRDTRYTLAFDGVFGAEDIQVTGAQAGAGLGIPRAPI